MHERVAVAVTSFALPQSVVDVTGLLRSIHLPTHLVCSGGQAPANVEVFRAQNVSIHVPPRPLSIQDARILAVTCIDARYIVFLDDDCWPTQGWADAVFAAVNDPANPDLFFGPRLPDSGSGLGTVVRRVEALSSRKLHAARLADSHRPIVAPRFSVAGGNMGIRRAAFPRTAPAEFAGAGFEDVDLQLTIQAAGGRVHFVPGMLVVHHHPLGLMGLIHKSLRSGRGIYHEERRHGRAYHRISRWTRGRLIRNCLAHITIGAALAYRPRIAAMALLARLWGARATGAALFEAAVYSLLAPVRDAGLLAGYAHATVHDRSRETLAPSCVECQVKSASRIDGLDMLSRPTPPEDERR